MRVTQLNVTNFMSIGKINIDLSKIGMTLVLGKNLDDVRFDSNGAAKSGLFEAMAWGLFGELLRDLPSEGIIRDGTDKVTVEVLVDPEDGSDKVLFSRYRTKKVHSVSVLTEKGVELFPANSVKDIQPQINNWLGLDFKTFTNSVYFGKGLVKFFMASNDTERKDLLENILQLVSFDDALERAKALSKKCETDLAEYSTNIAISTALIKEKTSNLIPLQNSLNEVKNKIIKEQPLLKEKVIKLQKTKDTLSNDILKIDSYIIEEKNIFDKKYDEINKLYLKSMTELDIVFNSISIDAELKYDEKINSVKNNYEELILERQEFCEELEEKKNLHLANISKFEVELAKTKGIIENINNEKNKIELLTDNLPCSECLQNISLEYKDKTIKKFNNSLYPFNNTINLLNKNIEMETILLHTECINPLAGVKNILLELETSRDIKVEALKKDKLQSLSDAQRQNNKERKIISFEYTNELNNLQETHYTKINSLVKERNDSNVENIKLDNNINSINKDIADMEEQSFKLNKQIISSKRDIEQINNQVSFIKEKTLTTQNIHDKTKFWIEGFGPRGIKSFIFESALPYLTERANYYSSYITGGTVVIDISPTTVVKSKPGHATSMSKEKIFVSTRNLHGAKYYSGNSDGERRRIDVCIILALQDLIATRATKKWNTFIFDEVFDVLDKAGSEHVLDLFRSFKDKSIYIISHSENLKKYFHTSITIQKKEGVSSIEGTL